MWVQDTKAWAIRAKVNKYIWGEKEQQKKEGYKKAHCEAVMKDKWQL